MQSLDKKNTDPTPSRIFYRWERLRLTPLFRLVIHYGIPIFLIGCIALFYFSKDENIEVLKVSWREFKENTKKGHDYAARVFAIKKTGATPLSNRAINYVFSSNSKVGENRPSPYTKKSIDNVIASTKDTLNEWVTVKANVKEDFKRFHNLDVDEIDGLAIMADTDNSKMKSIAYFQNIYFSAK